MLKVTRYRNGHTQWFTEMDQLAVAVCIWVWLQNTEDELRGKTQTCIATSNLKGAVVHEWPKLANFPAKFRKNPGGKNGNTDGQFVTFSRE